MIDSELVPWGKGEKQPGEGGEIDPETMRLQWAGAPQGVTVFLLKNEPTTYCFVARLSPSGAKPQGNQVLIGDLVANSRPETGWAIHDQDESHREMGGGPNPLAVQHKGMSCG